MGCLSPTLESLDWSSCFISDPNLLLMQSLEAADDDGSSSYFLPFIWKTWIDFFLKNIYFHLKFRIREIAETEIFHVLVHFSNAKTTRAELGEARSLNTIQTPMWAARILMFFLL